MTAAFSASRRGHVSGFHVMRVMELAGRRRAAGQPVFDLSVGQPGAGAPASVRAAARTAIERERLGYTGALGLPALRVAVAGHHRRSYGVDVDPASVVITTGSSGAFLLAFLAAFDQGDTVAVARPGYPAYRNMVQALGARVLDIPTGPGGALTVEQLDSIEGWPSGVVLASPSNPSGSMASAGQLAEIVAWCDERGIRLISDEIYHGITYACAAQSAWRAEGSAVVINSFSKYFCMTGWRLGWLLAPPELLDPIERLAGNFALCPPTLSQHAALGAFEAYNELDANVARYALNREFLLRRLPELGIDRIAPADGAFYVYADISRWTDDSLSWCARLLDETGVAFAPGIDFDQVDGGKFVRMCFAGDGAVIERAVEVMGDWLGRQPLW